MSRIPFLAIARRLSSEKQSLNILNLKDRGLIEVLLPTGSENYFLGSHNKPRTFYCGFDPTAPSLHLGNLTALMLLLHAQRRGHKVLALVGSATALIGDPSGRLTERGEMEEEQLVQNSNQITNTLVRIFENHEHMAQRQKFFQGTLGRWEVLDNASWNTNMSAVDLALNVGSFLRLGDLLSKESVKQRLEGGQGMSLKEFMYPMFQAHDWLRLFTERGCLTQVGGNDQQGNIDIGQQLIYKVTRQRAFGLTVPLLTRKDGTKIGKSENGSETLWLSPVKTNPFEFYQMLLRMGDAEVERLLKIFTFLPLSQIQQLMDNHKESPELRSAQITLAKELTLLVHGENGLKTAQVGTGIAFPAKDAVESKQALIGLNDVIAKALNIPVVSVVLEPNISVLCLLKKADPKAGESELIRLIEQGSVSINHEVVRNALEIIRFETFAHITQDNFSLLRIGKRKFFIIQWTD